MSSIDVRSTKRSSGSGWSNKLSSRILLPGMLLDLNTSSARIGESESWLQVASL